MVRIAGKGALTAYLLRDASAVGDRQPTARCRRPPVHEGRDVDSPEGSASGPLVRRRDRAEALTPVGYTLRVG